MDEIKSLKALQVLGKLILKSLNKKEGEDLLKELETIYNKKFDGDDNTDIFEIMSCIYTENKIEFRDDIISIGDRFEYKNNSKIRIGAPPAYLAISIGGFWVNSENECEEIPLNLLKEGQEWVDKLRREGRIDKEVNLGIMSYCSY